MHGAVVCLWAWLIRQQALSGKRKQSFAGLVAYSAGFDRCKICKEVIWWDYYTVRNSVKFSYSSCLF